MGSVDGFVSRLGLPVRDLRLLEQALTHTSYLHEHRDTAAGHNERLEFLGDAVVTLVISEALFARRPLDDEGALSARRAAIVSAHGLAMLARRIELGAYLRLGEGEARRDGRSRTSLLGSAFEAVVGALYLDLGLEQTRAWLIQIAAEEIESELPVSSLKSAKSRLQELTQRTNGERPTYRLVEATGPDHEKAFRVEVSVGGRVVGSGEGTSQKGAEIEAAEAALRIVLVSSPGGVDEAATEEAAGETATIGESLRRATGG